MKNLGDWYKKWPQRVLADLQAGAKAFGPIKPREFARANPLPLRGIGTRPDGGVTLAVTNRFVLVKDLSRDPPKQNLGATVLDSIVLSANDWAAFVPAKPESDHRWTLPEATARKFYPLLNTGDTAFRDPKEVTDVQFTAKVKKVENGFAQITFDGNIAGTHHGSKNEGKAGNKVSGSAKMLGGAGSYDVKAGKMIALTLVFDGLWRNYAPYDDPPARFGAVVEWRQTDAKP